MDRCDEFVLLLSQRLDGPLSGGEERALEEHLAVCPACRALGSQLAAIHAAFPEMEETPAPQGFAQGVMARVRAAEAEKKKVVPLFRRPQVKALAGLAACAVLCVGLYRAGVLDLRPEGGAGGIDAASVQLEEPPMNRTASERASPAPKLFSAEPSGGEEEISGQTVTGSSAETGRENAGPEEKNASDSDKDTDQEVQDVQPSLFSAAPQTAEGRDTAPASPPPVYYQFGGGQAVPMYVGGLVVNARLMLERLPEGAGEVLGAEAEWLTDEEGRDFCVITGEEMEAVMGLAEEQGQDLTGAATGRIAPEELCALVLTGDDSQPPADDSQNTP